MVSRPYGLWMLREELIPPTTLNSFNNQHNQIPNPTLQINTYNPINNPSSSVKYICQRPHRRVKRTLLLLRILESGSNLPPLHNHLYIVNLYLPKP
ncbi:MAG: hypothetical protein ACK4TI_00290 [Nitrososphaerales archaeon]